MFGALFCILCERRGPSCCGEWAFVVGSGFGSGGLCDCRLLGFTRRRCDLRGGGASLVSWDWCGGWGGCMSTEVSVWRGGGDMGGGGGSVCSVLLSTLGSWVSL